MDTLPPVTIMNSKCDAFVYGNKQARDEMKDTFNVPFYEYKIKFEDGIKYMYPEDFENLKRKKEIEFPF